MQKFVTMRMLNISSPLGGDVEEIGHFQNRKLRSYGTFFFASPLAIEKNGKFQLRELRSHGSILLASPYVQFPFKTIVPMQTFVTMRENQT